MPRLISGLDAGASARTSTACARRSPRPRGARAATRASVEILAAVKYVAARGDRRRSREAGHRRSLGENRAQDLEAKADGPSRRFRWHFIGQLQSRKVKQILPHVELIHSVASDSALASSSATARRRPRSSSRSTSPGRRARRGSRRPSSARFLDALPGAASSGLMTMPPFAEDPEASRPALRRAARARRRARAAPPLDGHVAGLRGRRRGGRDDRAHGLDAVR